MIKIMAFLHAKPGLPIDDVIDHYENHHVPLVLSLAPAPVPYRRNFVRSPDGPDIITELGFPDDATYRAWVATMYAPDSGVAADEATFLDRARTVSHVVEEHVTPPTG